MASIFMRFPEGKKKALTLSYDDGVQQDVKLIEIMQKHGLKGTFNLNSGAYAPEGKIYPEGTIHRRMSEKQVTETYKDSGMEVAVHALTHPFLEQLSAAACTYEVVKDRENLEAQFGTIVRGMAYPFGTYSDQVVDCLKASGIAYSRTTISNCDFKIPTDWLRLEATCHHKNPRLMELAHKFVEQDTARAPWLFYLWGHSYEFEADNNWNVIEEFAEYTGGHDDIWYATNIEIYDYVEAYRSLVFSVNGSRVYNPTAITLYLEKAGVTYCVKPGESIEL